MIVCDDVQALQPNPLPVCQGSEHDGRVRKALPESRLCEHACADAS